jgi:galactose oxidase
MGKVYRNVMIALSFMSITGLFPTYVEAQITTKAVVVVSQVGGKCLRVVNGSTADGAAVTQWTCNDSLGSRWTLLPQVGGSAPYVQVIAAHSGKCLSVSGTGNAAPVVQASCTGINSQRWIVQNFGQFYRLMAYSGLCLNVSEAVPDNGARLIQWPCVGGINEIWAFSEGFLGQTDRTRLVNSSSNLCAEDSGFSLAENSSIILWNCKRAGSGSDVTNQQWALRRVFDGYQLNVLSSTKCLAPLGASIANDAPIVQATCASATYQTWALNADGTLRNKNSILCLDSNNPGGTQGSTLSQHTCNGGASQKWRLTSAADVGSWSSRITLPLVPVAVATLKNNQLMFWSAYDGFTFEQNLHGWTQTALYDIASGSVFSVQVSNTGHDMFCPGTAMLSDGRVLVNGGDTAPATSIYNPDTRLWSIGGNMHIPRGYNADVVLDSAKIFTLGGSWNGGQGGKSGELWTPTGWANLAGASSAPIIGPDPEGVYRGDNHAWLFSTGAGKVFHAGPSAQMNWFDTNGGGSSVSAGKRGTDNYSINGNAVMYGNKKILKLGGAPAYEGANAVASAYTINIQQSTPVVTQVGSLTYARTFSNSVVLPDGTVFVAGGQQFGQPFSDSQSILVSELWSNLTGNFTTRAAEDTPRNYHSVAVLLQDGRVLSGGGGLCGNCDTNHPDFEYYSPGYLFQPSGLPAVRPVIHNAPSKAGYNQPITVRTDVGVTSFVLIRMSAATHSVNNDQRRIPLPLTAQAGTTYTVTTPADSGIGVPGYYMLFALKANGVPSIAAIILIGNV